jgi:hypothetical protein
MANYTNITPPRVAFLDERTGLISREWYRFFLNMFQLTGGGQSDLTLVDLQQGPTPTAPLDPAMLDAMLPPAPAAPQIGTLASENADNVRMLGFSTAPSPTVVGAPGVVVWNDTDGTLDLGLKGGDVTLQIGQEEVMLVKHADNSGIVEGEAYYFVGSTGTNKTVRKARANSGTTSDTTLGLATESATGGDKAFLTTFGLVRNINTNALTEGAEVFLSPSVAGALTPTRPTAPDHAVRIGYCVRKSATVGSIFVSIDTGTHLGALHDVRITSVANNDALKYDSGLGYWKNVPFDTSALTDYTTGTYTPTVTAQTGTITTYTATGAYTKIGRLINVSAKITITTNGTAAGYLIMSLPSGLAADNAITQIGAGREDGVTGDMLQVLSAASNVNIVSYDGVYPGGDGHVVYATLTYYT